MNFTFEELEIIKDALIIALNQSQELLEDPSGVIKILDKIDGEPEDCDQKIDSTNYCKFCDSPIELDPVLNMWVNINANRGHTTKNPNEPSDMSCIFNGKVKSHKPKL